MAKKFESPPDTETKNFEDNSVRISLEDLKIELAQFSLIFSYDDYKHKIKIEPMEKNPAQLEIEKLKVELAKLGLKIIDDIKLKQVSKPEEAYNSLVALYNALKN